MVLTRQEVCCAFSHLEGVHLLVAKLLYGTGMRIMEALRLRTKDIDFDHNCIIIRCRKGNKDRVVTLPASLVRLPAFIAGTIYIHKLSGETSSAHLKVLPFTNLPLRTHYGIASQRTCFNLALKFERLKDCCGTTT